MTVIIFIFKICDGEEGPWLSCITKSILIATTEKGRRKFKKFRTNNDNG